MTSNLKSNAQSQASRRHAHFTSHGRWRASQRCQMEPERLARLLDKGKFVTLGTEPGFNRSHRLFYSAVDGAAFVAIQDTLTGAVITIWPLAYRDSLPWRISEADLLKAQALATNRQEPSTTQCRVHYCIEGVQRTRTVMRLRGKLEELRKAVREASFQEEVVRAAERQGISRRDLFAFSLGHRANPGERHEINRTDN